MIPRALQILFTSKIFYVIKVKATIDGNSNEATETMPIIETSSGEWYAEINKSVQSSIFRNIGVTTN